MKKVLLAGSVVLTLAGCVTGTDESAIAAEEMNAVNARKISQLEQQLASAERELTVMKEEQQRASETPAVPVNDLLPPNAKPGECYARVWVEPTYRTVENEVMVKEAMEQVQAIPAQYELAEEKMLVKEASTRLEEAPAVYGTETETIMVKEAEKVWRTRLDSQAPRASEELLAAARKGGISLDTAEVGMCFHEHYRPEQYETVTEQVEVSSQSYRIETVPAEYRWLEKEVLVKEASTRLVEVPAVYETVTETVVDVPAHTIWKKGTGPIQKIDEATGEIMCLVAVPATYKSIEKRLLKSPAHTDVVEIPAEYKTVKVRELVTPASEQRIELPAKYDTVAISKLLSEGSYLWHEIHDPSESRKTRTGAKICLVETPAEYETLKRRVVLTPASTRTIEIPAEYETVKVKKLVSAAREERTKIPAEYKTVTLKEIEQDGHMEWRTILCDTNTTADLISRLQQVLNEKGYDLGPVDGELGAETMRAVNNYQRDNNLPVDRYLNIETMQHLQIL